MSSTPMEELTEVAPLVLQGLETKMALARRVIAGIREQLDGLERVLEGGSGEEAEALEALLLKQREDDMELVSPLTQSRSIDGVFDGEHMVGEDGRSYLVPPNYASKSKLVEGDLLRLIITDGGKFIFKQKGPIERQRLVGMLVCDEQSDCWYVVAESRKHRVLTPAISFFKGQPGDDVVILTPKNTPSQWAAVENVIKKDLSAFN